LGGGGFGGVGGWGVFVGGLKECRCSSLPLAGAVLKGDLVLQVPQIKAQSQQRGSVRLTRESS